MTRASKIVSLLIILSLVLVALPFPLANVARATTLASDVWVAPPPKGSDGNLGTKAHPFATITKGIETVDTNEGGTVHVAAGTYHENLHISMAANLIGAGAPDTIIDGDGSGHVIDISSGPWENIISGFTIQNGYVTSSLWNPADEQVLYAGIKLPSIKMLPQLFGAVPDGGGIYISGQHIVTLNDCVIKDNQAEHGGGIYNEGELYMNRCTISGNHASKGSGIHNMPDATATLTNCTISGNSGNGAGGGIRNWGNMWCYSVTMSENHGSVGGGFSNDGAPARMYFKNCVVAGNTGGDGIHNNGYDDLDGTGINSQGYNIDSENSCYFTDATDQRNTNPLLGALQDNGGPTFTHALLHGSPAIDAGANAGTPATDQRGIPRPQGIRCDIGAYELAQASVTTATGTGTASFSTLDGYITDLTALAQSALTCPPRPGLDFPHGYFSFNVNGITPGSAVTIVIILPSNMPTNTQYWKCINGQWVDCTSLLGSNDGDSVLTLTITDGDLGDRDGKRNGTIVDPGGPVEIIAIQTPSGLRVSPTLPRTLTPAQMSLQYLSVTPQQTGAGQPVTISTNLVNTGDEAGNLNIALKINGQAEQNKMVSVGPQGTQPVKFTVTKAQPGTYSVDIGGQKGNFIVTGSGGTARAPVNGGMIAILILGILVLITIVALIARRRPA